MSEEINDMVSNYPETNWLLNRSRLVIKNQGLDSTNWELVKPRKTDIVIASCYKSGTTLTQQIVNLLINGDKDFESIHEISPWIDAAVEPPVPAVIESLPDPRFFKSHLPFEGLPYYPNWKYIYLTRDGRDACLSLYNQLQHRKAWLLETSENQLLQGDYGLDDFSEFWNKWVETGEPRWPFWEHINSWWKVRHLPNILLVHYTDLINDKSQEVQRIANFLNVKLESSRLNLVLERSTLKYMKENWQKFQRPGLLPPNTFVNKGTNGRWQNLLTPEQLSHYEIVISQKLEPDCANWVKNGGSIKLDDV